MLNTFLWLNAIAYSGLCLREICVLTRSATPSIILNDGNARKLHLYLLSCHSSFSSLFPPHNLLTLAICPLRHPPPRFFVTQITSRHPPTSYFRHPPLRSPRHHAKHPLITLLPRPLNTFPPRPLLTPTRYCFPSPTVHYPPETQLYLVLSR